MDLNACRAKKREARQRAEQTLWEEQEQTREKKEKEAARKAEIRQNKDARIAAEKAASKAESKAEEAQSRLECVVCLEQEKTHIFIPCGHKCVCKACADVVMKNVGAKCPLCRKKASQVCRVFD